VVVVVVVQVAKDNGVTSYRMMRRIIGEPDVSVTTTAAAPVVVHAATSSAASVAGRLFTPALTALASLLPLSS